MASARSIRRGQNLLCCQLCNLYAKLEYKCIYCKLLLCGQCDKSHRKTTGHFVMCIQDIGTHEGKVDFSNLKCDRHSSPACSYCTTCDVLVCSRCVTKGHKQHDMIEICEGYDLVKRSLKSDKEYFEQQLRNVLSLTHNLRQLKKVHKKKTSDEIQTIKHHGDDLKRAIDTFIKDISTEVEQKGESILHSIEVDLRKLTDIKRNADEKLDILREQIQNTDAKTFFKFGCDYQRPDTSVPTVSSLYLTVPNFVPGNVEKSHVGVLQPPKCFPQIIEDTQIETYTSNISIITAIKPCSDETILLSGYRDEKLELVKLKDRRLEVLKSYNKVIYDIGITSSNKTLVSVEGETALQVIDIGDGKLSNTVYNVPHLQPRHFVIADSGSVIIRALNKSCGKGTLIHLDAKGGKVHMYDKDAENEPLFMFPLLLAQTSNKLIHVVDCEKSSKVGKITVVNEDGRLCNTYCGHPDVNRGILFRPQGITVTPQDNVLVADRNSHYLHLLNNVGYIMSVINVGSLGVSFPVTLHLSSSGILYIGCVSEQYSDKNAKLCVVKSLSI